MNTTGKNALMWFIFVHLLVLLAVVILVVPSEYSPRTGLTGHTMKLSIILLSHKLFPVVPSTLVYILQDSAQISYSTKTSPILFPSFLASLSCCGPTNMVNSITLCIKRIVISGNFSSSLDSKTLL